MIVDLLEISAIHAAYLDGATIPVLLMQELLGRVGGFNQKQSTRKTDEG